MRHEVPVALFVFNRPDFVRRVMAVLAQVRPSLLLVVADGPRAGVESDEQLCTESRRIANEFGWPCEVINHWSGVNMGCDRRMRSGLDWVFEQVDQAIVLEDDIVPHASFFSWCERMLDTYRDATDISLVSGRNTLCRWGDDEAIDHLIVRRGSIHGWATWASAWRGVTDDLSTVCSDDLSRHLDGLDLDPTSRTHVEMLAGLVRANQLSAWDTRWSLALLLANRWSVVPPVNLTLNIGFGDRATRTCNGDDLRGFIPAFAAPGPVNGTGRPDCNPEYDRLSLLVELLAAYRQPEMVIRLAKHRTLLVNSDGSPDAVALAHLAPIDNVEDSIDVLRHLRNAGVDSRSVDNILGALEASVAEAAQ